jgi:uncharacterized protein (DUF1499 family)
VPVTPDRPLAARLRMAGWGAASVAAACGVADLLGALAYRAGWLALGPALQTMRVATIVALAAFAVALCALLLSVRAGAPRGAVVAGFAAVLALCVAGPPVYLWRQGQVLPHIHDISTDTLNPPAFEALVPLRQGARNPTRYDPRTAAAQQAGYPDIGPVALSLPPARAMVLAAQAAREMGWRIAADSPAALRIEATATTALFGFEDDVVIRVTPSANGSRIDVRSLSRVGGSDFGANAKRIRAFSERLRDLASRS